jgi:hypothetical protein
MFKTLKLEGARPWEGGRQYLEHMIIRSVQIFIFGLLAAVIYALWASIPRTAGKWFLLDAVLVAIAIEFFILVVFVLIIMSRGYHLSLNIANWRVKISLGSARDGSPSKASQSSAS